MPTRSDAVDNLPAAAAGALARLGGDLSVARKRRKQSLRGWATRLNVSVPTLMKMEKGDPTVSIGVYATALWMIQRHDALADLADPRQDLAALESEVQRATRRGARVDG
jgi:hypothetical protein